MRVLLVSAHYPPNFVSGGTLQPARLARGLADRGHEVSVYAGWLGEDRPALSTHATIEDGIDVRWIATSHFVAWNNDRNWDNPDVAADFAAFLRQYDPDVVHVHSLQTLGAGVVRQAVTHRARVVVTMHDFWWLCARTFLVDRTWSPCSLVVDCGDCPCELGRRWLDARTETLRQVLAGVDAVLAPSEVAAGVLRANGIEGVEVDENGFDGVLTVPEPDRPGAGAGADGVTLLYLGGPDPMKGAHALADIAERLGHLPGWRLVAYGLDEAALPAAARAPETEGIPMELRAAFAPGDRGRVLAEADVLLVPSLMRETHSLVTREALRQGIPVVCSDSLGPEEVVRHDDNGLVVPVSDAPSLVDGFVSALEGLITDPGLLDRLRRGAAGGVPVRSLDEQVSGLEERYRELTADPPPLRPPDRVRSVCFIVGIDGAPLRYRTLLPAEALALVGVSSEVRWYRDPDVSTVALAADAVVLYRVPATVEVLDLVERVRERGRPVLFDVDDLIFDPDLASEIPALGLLPPDEAALWLEGVRRYRTTMEASDVFVGSTRALTEHAAKVVEDLPVERFENGIGVVVAQVAEQALRRPRSPGAIRLGYFSGTTTHDDDWKMVAPAIAEVLARHPAVELWLGGHVPETAPLAPFEHRVRRLGFVAWPRLIGLLRDVDVNLAPLELGSRFNEAKSAIKWLEAALVATPTVASSTEPFRDAVRDGATGLLASTPEDWTAAVEALVVDAERRSLLGYRARREALLRWSPRLQGLRYRELLERAATEHVGRAARRRSEWQPLAPSEPSEPFRRSIEADRLRVPVRRRVARALVVARARLDRERSWARGMRTRARDLLAQEGPAGPVRGALRVARRRSR